MTPDSAASSRWTSARSARSRTSTARPPKRLRKAPAKPPPSSLRVRATSSVVTTMRPTPSARSRFRIPASGICPTGSWPPVMATVPLCSSFRVTSTPEATSARTASEPEWKNVPSPRFCTRWRSRTNGLMPIQCAPSPPICVVPVTSPTRFSSMSSTIAWQPMPAPTRLSPVTRVDALWGQPEQKCGVRAGTDRGSALRRIGAGAGASCEIPRRPSTGGSAAAMSRAGSRRGRWSDSYRAACTDSRRKVPLSSTTMISSSPAAKSSICSGSSGHVMPKRSTRTPSGEPRSRRVSSTARAGAPAQTMPRRSASPSWRTRLRPRSRA